MAAFSDLDGMDNAGFSVIGNTRSLPLRGLTPDPLDALPWLDRTGRQHDILYRDADGIAVTFPVVSNFTLEQTQQATGAFLARATAEPGRIIWDDHRGTLVLHPRVKVLTRCCRQCGESFRQWRFPTQRRRYATFCSADHRAAYKRVTDRQRQQERRGRLTSHV
ncbi:hypothetical protein OG243_26615 [Streptomyces sp. NBC_01318]|uniref:hypothetical protein n=1 Tax=Streptomyces sp. NBC_01318 TaxID=2903823 RepID=UPI002E122719|nr:hypothetical protein OG243_26615 [Streptomyces sp. NBC_01318]